jgi:hypothetical protein
VFDRRAVAVDRRRIAAPSHPIRRPIAAASPLHRRSIAAASPAPSTRIDPPGGVARRPAPHVATGGPALARDAQAGPEFWPRDRGIRPPRSLP